MNEAAAVMIFVTGFVAGGVSVALFFFILGARE